MKNAPNAARGQRKPRRGRIPGEGQNQSLTEAETIYDAPAPIQYPASEKTKNLS